MEGNTHNLEEEILNTFNQFLLSQFSVVYIALSNKQKKNPSDYVISTGKQYTVKQFVDLTLRELNIKFKWSGKGIKAKCYDNFGRCIVACDKKYFRPLEVDTLLGDSKKAKRELNWKPKINIKKLVKEMVDFELKKLSNG